MNWSIHFICLCNSGSLLSSFDNFLEWYGLREMNLICGNSSVKNMKDIFSVNLVVYRVILDMNSSNCLIFPMR